MSSALGNIEHVIVLMFENRSFDHILGAMPNCNGLMAGGTVNPAFYNTMQPLVAPGTSNPSVPPTPIVPGPGSEGQVIVHDFNHDFGDGMSQDLFGPGTTGVIQGEPQNNPTTTYPATNSGFLSAVGNSDNGVQDPSVMTYFEWGSMQVFHTLAQSFVACDAWHCDMPGHTAPNRAFMHCATTGDIGIDDNDDVGSSTMVNRLTIFERIQQQGETWKMYWMGSNCDTNWLNEQVLSQQYSENDPAGFNVTNVPIAVFFNDLTNGTLPFYSFIMCWSDIASTSMHPAASVEAGENLLACIYNALSQSPYWGNTLLVVNFDENGGIYDHVGVPQTVAPDADPNSGQPPPVWSWTENQTYSFDFTTLGVRIPVLLISPWLTQGVCSTQYQNTSILRFLQDMLAQPALPNWLTHRDEYAPSIAPVFDYDQFGSQTQRTDCPSNVQGYPQGGITCAQLASFAPPTPEQLAAKPAPHIVKMTRQYLRPLPGHPDSGKPITRDFATVGEMRAYAKERMDAAQAYLKAKSRPR